MEKRRKWVGKINSPAVGTKPDENYVTYRQLTTWGREDSTITGTGYRSLAGAASCCP